MHLAIGSATDLVDGLAFEALQFVHSVVDLDFFSVLWICYVHSTHVWRFSFSNVIIINFLNHLLRLYHVNVIIFFCTFGWGFVIHHTLYIKKSDMWKSGKYSSING